MIKLSMASQSLHWIIGNNEPALDIILTISDNEYVRDRLIPIITALRSVYTSYDYSLIEDGEIDINVGDPINHPGTDGNVTISFTLENVDNDFKTITATRSDFLEFIDLYGMAGALQHVFNLAIDEYDTTSPLSKWVPVTLIINDLT